MAKKSQKQNAKNTDEKSTQEFTDKEFMSFALRMMVAFEVEKYLENSFREYDLAARLDDLLSGVDEEFLKGVEDFGARDQD